MNVERLIAEIREAHRAAQASIEKGLTHAMAAGDNLITLKGEVRHGELFLFELRCRLCRSR